MDASNMRGRAGCRTAPRAARPGRLARLGGSGLSLAALLSLAACGGGGSGPAVENAPPVVKPVVAAADTLSLAPGASGQLLANDTLDGAAASAGSGGNVSFVLSSGTLPTGVTLANGLLAVAADAPPASVSLGYKICELASPTNCASATAQLTVLPPAIQAVADSFNLLPGGSGDVLANDRLGAAAATAATVAASATGALPSGLSLAASGVLAVAGGTAAGSYTVNYRICQASVTTNCADAAASVTVQAIGAVHGRAIDAATGQGVPNVTVRAGAAVTTTDSGGSFTLGTLPLADRLTVAFSGGGYAESARVTSVTAGSNADVQVRLTRVAASVALDAAAGGTATVSGSPATVTLPANAVQRGDGSLPSGNITVALTPIAAGQDSALMPGDFTTVAAGTVAPIESFGALNVQLTDSAGAALGLRSGQTATVRIPLSSRSAAPPATIPLFYFDNATGRWVQEGTATLAGSGSAQYYEGTVSHFSTWNADQVYDTVRITGCVANASGTPISGALVASDGVSYTGTSMVFTDGAGNFTIPLRKASEATLVASSGGLFTNTVRVGPFSADTTLGSCLALGQTGAGVTMKLTWGLHPSDLDSHLTTPSGAHIAYYSKGGLVAAPYANLDVDDTSSYGPEVVTISRLMVGTYRYSVHNFSSQSSGFIGASGARVELNVPGRSLELFVPPATGETVSTNWWHLFEMDVDARCNVTVRRVGTLSASAVTTPASATPTYCSVN